MSISLTSFIPSRSKRRAAAVRGFTLVELLVSIGIMLLVMGTIFFRYASFDSMVLLKTLTYDIALSVRTAQTHAVSVFGSEQGFRVPYGLSFTPGATEYVFFGYTGAAEPPRYASGSAFVVDVYQLGRNFLISDICIVVSGSERCDIDRLDIAFERPEYTALFYAAGYGGNMSNIQSGIIRVQSRDGEITGQITVGYAGHVSVSLADE